MNKKSPPSSNRSMNSMKKAIITLASRKDQISSVDLAGRVPSLTGSARGAIVRNAFNALVNEGTIKVVKSAGEIQTVYNKINHNRVTLYARTSK